MTEVAANGNHLGEKIDRDSAGGNAGWFASFNMNITSATEWNMLN